MIGITAFSDLFTRAFDLDMQNLLAID